MSEASSHARRITSPIPAMPHRPELVAAISFVEDVGSHRMDRAGLSNWIALHLVAAGRMPRPSAVYEPGTGVVGLRTQLRRNDDVLTDLMLHARERTLTALRGLLATPSRDGFVLAALHAARVHRCQDRSGWAASPHTSDALSDIVLSLFAADILGWREEYEERLRICALCGRVALDGTARWGRGTCFAHPFG